MVPVVIRAHINRVSGAICCPNYKEAGDHHCPENSLSVSWAKGAVEFITNGEIKEGYGVVCFQCGVTIQEWRDA